MLHFFYMNKNLIKNILAVIASFMLIAILSIVTDSILEKFVASINLVFALFYRSIFTIIGGYTTAMLSKTNPQRQVYILAGIGFVIGSIASYANWNLAVGDEWYPIAIAVTGPIFVWVGGKLFIKN